MTKQKLNILCLGAGYVGGPTMSVIAEKCPENKVVVSDLNQARIDAWNSEELPVFEPGLYEVVKRARGRNLFFQVLSPELISEADLIFVSVNTPTKLYGQGSGMAADLKYWELAARDIRKHARDKTIIVEKSTVPVKTAEAISRILNSNDEGKTFPVLSNPEFLAEGTAIKDLYDPGRILIGHELTEDGRRAAEVLRKVYAKWVPDEKILLLDVWSSELSKLAANAMLAQRVSSINAISALCERTNADVQNISRAVGTDPRIGNKFLQASVGFGGSCFKKDILNLVYICETHGLPEVAAYWKSVVSMNEYQTSRFVRAVLESQFNTVSGKKIAILGTAFKPDTNDTRESPALYVCKKLLEEGAHLYLHDPKALENTRLDLQGIDENITYCEDVFAALSDAHCALFLTQWEEYRRLDFQKVYKSMEKPAYIFDGRVFLDKEALYKMGFNVYTIGTKPLYHF